MYSLRITITRVGKHRTSEGATRVLTITTDSTKPPTKARVARLLSAKLPAFRRRRGRASILAGAEILPVLEKNRLGLEGLAFADRPQPALRLRAADQGTSWKIQLTGQSILES